MNVHFYNIARVAFLAIALVAVTACGGGSGTPPPAMYSIGGTVSGLDAGQSVLLQNNGGHDLTVSANVAFTFVTKVASGGAYTVTVAGFPAGKTCTATGASGTASANVTGVAVACVTIPTFSIGGSVSGLVGQGLKLELVALVRSYAFTGYGREVVDTLGINKNGKFAFGANQTPQRPYFVDIATQPNAPAQRCVVKHPGAALVTADVTDVDVACGEFAYVTHAADNTISAFSIDATTGAIAPVGPPVSVGMSPYAIASTSNKEYVYVVNSGSNDVSAFAVDSISGALTTVPGSPFAAGTNPRALAVDEFNHLYVANAGSDNLSAYAIDQSTGVLAPMSVLSGSVVTGAGPSAIAIHPGISDIYYNPFLYTANTGGSKDMSAFLIDANTGGLTPKAGSPFPSGSNVSSLAFGGSPNTYPLFLYAANATGGTAAIYGFSIDLGYVDVNGGSLTSLSGFPFPLASCTYIVADQTGTYLYATAGTNVLGYSIDAQTGALSLLPGFPVAVGANADSVTIDPTNQFLYVRSGSAGTVTGFELNAATGALTPMLGSPFAVGTSANFITTF